MPVQQLPPPPRTGDAKMDDWMNKLWRRVIADDFQRNAESITVAASAAINTTETIVAGGLSESKVPANSLKIGSTVRITLNGTCTSSVGNVSTFRVRFGSAGTTADGVLGSAATAAAAAAGTAIPFKVVIEFTVRTVGATGTIAGTLTLTNQGITGIATVVSQTIALTPAAIDTTVDRWLSATYVAAATTTTCTFQQGIIEIVGV